MHTWGEHAKRLTELLTELPKLRIKPDTPGLRDSNATNCTT